MAHSLGVFGPSARRRSTRWQSRLYQEAAAVEREIRGAQRRFRQSVPAFLRTSSLRNPVTALLVYSLAIPLVLADVLVSNQARAPRPGSSCPVSHVRLT
jgi:hypothetical protein